MTDSTKRLIAAARSLNRAIDAVNTDRWAADLAHGETPDDGQFHPEVEGSTATMTGRSRNGHRRLVAHLIKEATAAENAVDARTLERNAW